MKPETLNYIKNFHEYPHTGKVIGGTMLAVPTLALSQYLGMNTPLSVALTGLAGIGGAYLGKAW